MFSKFKFNSAASNNIVSHSFYYVEHAVRMYMRKV